MELLHNYIEAIVFVSRLQTKTLTGIEVKYNNLFRSTGSLPVVLRSSGERGRGPQKAESCIFKNLSDLAYERY